MRHVFLKDYTGGGKKRKNNGVFNLLSRITFLMKGQGGRQLEGAKGDKEPEDTSMLEICGSPQMT